MIHFCREISPSSSQLPKHHAAQLVKMQVPARAILKAQVGRLTRPDLMLAPTVIPYCLTCVICS